MMRHSPARLGRRQLLLVALLAAASLLCTNCSPVGMRFYEGPQMDRDQVAILYASPQAVTGSYQDGRTKLTAINGKPLAVAPDSWVELRAPGRYTATIALASRGSGGGDLRFEVVRGTQYYVATATARLTTRDLDPVAMSPGAKYAEYAATIEPLDQLATVLESKISEAKDEYQKERYVEQLDRVRRALQGEFPPRSGE